MYNEKILIPQYTFHVFKIAISNWKLTFWYDGKPMFFVVAQKILCSSIVPFSRNVFVNGVNILHFSAFSDVTYN